MAALSGRQRAGWATTNVVVVLLVLIPVAWLLSPDSDQVSGAACSAAAID